MLRCAIYARFSNDNSNPLSAEDQVTVCRERAEREGWTIVNVFTDEVVSGAVLKRPGMTRMLREITARAFDIVLAEDMDRISRDQEDIAHVWKRVRFSGAEIYTLADGIIGPIHIGMKGTMNAVELEKNAHKQRRGAIGALSRGRIPGGMCYGYEADPLLLDDGTVDRGRRRIVPEQAAVIRWIYAEYVAGKSPRAIAKELNAQRIPSPAGKEWRAVTITGSAGRQLGILKNPIYVGRFVWNRVQMKLHPDSRKRQSRVNPVADRREIAVPELRIIDDATWSAAQTIAAETAGVPLTYRQRPRHFLSQLVKCGECGGNYTVIDRNRWGCSRHREAGTCGNGRRIAGAELEDRVLAGLKEKLLSPEAVAAAVSRARKKLSEQNVEKAGARRSAEKRLKAAEEAIARLVDAIDGGGGTFAQLHTKLAEREAERAQAAAELEEHEASTVIMLHPQLAEAYRRRIEDLAATLTKGPVTHENSAGKIRALFDRVVVTPIGDGTNDITVVASLQATLALGQDGPSRRRSASRGALVVAEDRYHQSPPWDLRSFKA